MHREPGQKVLRCTVCEREYPMDHVARWVRHVRDCSERNADQMEAVAARYKANELAQPSDPELYRHIREGKN